MDTENFDVCQFIGEVKVIKQEEFDSFGISKGAIEKATESLMPDDFNPAENIDVLPVVFNLANVNEFNKNGDGLSFEVKSDLSEIFIFNSLCIHTNQPRFEDSRISIDIRINPVDRFVDGYVGSGRMKAEFKPGGKFGYFEKSVKEILWKY